jgi:hypothetical protein
MSRAPLGRLQRRNRRDCADAKTVRDVGHPVGWVIGDLVAGDGGVDGAGPGVDASGERLDLLEALIAEPHGDREGARAVMAEDDDGGVRVELGVGAGRYFAHGHEERIGEARGLVLPGLSDVEEERGLGLLAQLGKCLCGDFWF